jgi:hypothetical protein
MIPVLPGKTRPFTEQQASTTDGIFLTSNGTNFHESGAASPKNFIVGFIRVHSFYSWFKCSALGLPGRTGSCGFPAGQVVCGVFSSFVMVCFVSGLVFMTAVGFSDWCG